MERYFDVNREGCSVRCKLYVKDVHDIRKVVVYGHGFGGHKDNKACARFAEKAISKYKGMAVICFNWPCHGDDARPKLILTDCELYLSLIISYIKETYMTDDIYGYATSFGGFVFLKYIADNGMPFKKVVLRCPAVKMWDVLYSSLVDEGSEESLRKTGKALIGFDRKVTVTAEFLDELKAADLYNFDYLDYADNLLLIHGTADEVVSFDDTKSFSEENVIELIPMEGVDHRFRDPQKMDLAISMILEWFFK